MFDVLVGINLLREGLDLPEVSRVAILDADKVGFLRSEVSLIQTIGRAARNVNGKVIMYADSVTEAMQSAIAETYRRRKLQLDFNEKHGIVPRTISKSVRDVISTGSIVGEEGQDALEKLLRPASAQTGKGRTGAENRAKYAGGRLTKHSGSDSGAEAAMILTDEELELSVDSLLELLTGRMSEAAGELRFEEAAKYRDIIKKLRQSGSSK